MDGPYKGLKLRLGINLPSEGSVPLPDRITFEHDDTHAYVQRWVPNPKATEGSPSLVPAYFYEEPT